jgi:hypothetical protein
MNFPLEYNGSELVVPIIDMINIVSKLNLFSVKTPYM